MRLAFFVLSLLLLPLLGLHLEGREWSGLTSSELADDPGIAAALHTSMMLLFYTLLLNHAIRRLTGAAPLDPQRFMRAAAAGALLGWLISYLNLFVASWTHQQEPSWQLTLLLYTPLFALTAPAVLATRAFFAGFPVLQNALAALPSLPVPNRKLAAMLAAASLAGLAAGAAEPHQFAWLFWASPSLLLYALQRQAERDVAGSGQAVFAMLSGLVVGNFALASYQANANLAIDLPAGLTQPGYALFGLLCLQLIGLTGGTQKTIS